MNRRPPVSTSTVDHTRPALADSQEARPAPGSDPTAAENTRPATSPWHQRFALVRGPRALARSSFFSVLRAALRTDDGRQIIMEALEELPGNRPPALLSAIGEAPYPELGRARQDRTTPARRPVFITARFRSGSTMLWNLFRHVRGCTSYYEPFNERRWFDPSQHGTRVDRAHRQVDDYWREYEGLEALGQHYDERWTRSQLYMDERSWNPAMARYVRMLVDRAPGRPILQFNRIDFRLPWFRQAFPEATIVHLYRHPRDQWCSSLVDPKASSPTSTVADFRGHEGFYLLGWATDLKYRFPFLNVAEHEHPYRVFYLIWKLSFMFGVTYSDISVRYESIVADPMRELPRLFGALGLEHVDYDQLGCLIDPSTRRWAAYAPDAWFQAHEEACEDVLREFFPEADAPQLRFRPGASAQFVR